MLREKLPHKEILERKIICGNPYSFQGDERDVIFLSMVIAPNRRPGVLNRKSDERRFNVAVSRARDQIWLFHSVTAEDINPHCLRKKLLDFFYKTKTPQIIGVNLEELEKRCYYAKRNIEKPPAPFESWFEVDVALEIVKKGYNAIPQFRVGNYRIDLVIDGGHSRIAVECDGDIYHGIDKIEEDLFRQKVLERCGWQFFRIRASEFYLNKEKSLEDLWKLLERNRIYPLKQKAR
jgi:very-short-patch-repair endonuclease